jgi:hypothetical protein
MANPWNPISGVDAGIHNNKQLVQANATLTATGSQVISTGQYGTCEIDLIVNIKNAPTGTTPSITWSIQEVDPGDQVTAIGAAVTGTAMTAAGTQVITIRTSVTGVVQVTWTITGTTPSFTGVYATLLSKLPGVILGLTAGGVVVPVRVDANGDISVTVSPIPSSATSGLAKGYITTTATTNVPVRATTYTEQTTNFTGSVVSGNVADAAAGTGARTLTITFIDQTGATLGTENATLNGTTAVNLVTTTKCFIEKIVVTSVGSGGSNVGIITLFTGAGGAGTNVGSIAVGDNQTFWAQHYVVSGKTCHVISASGLNNNSVAGNASIFSIFEQTIPVGTNVDLQLSDWFTGDQDFQVQRAYSSLLVPGPARILLFALPGGTTSLKNLGSFEFWDQ